MVKDNVKNLKPCVHGAEVLAAAYESGLKPQDILDYRHRPGFNIPSSLSDGETITGHIDFLQIRNGCVHILDYKPGAKKERPIGQLMIYALALSRLTGLRLYDFKCAWFDETGYYQFYPLQVVRKPKAKADVADVMS